MSEHIMNKHISAFLQDIEKRQEKPARALAKKQNQALADIARRKKPFQQRADKMRAELAAARDWLANIPVDCEPSTIATNQAIVDRWPALIGDVQNEIGKIDLERRQLETNYGYEMRHLQANAGVELQQAIVDLRMAEPDIHQFVK